MNTEVLSLGSLARAEITVHDAAREALTQFEGKFNCGSSENATEPGWSQQLSDQVYEGLKECTFLVLSKLKSWTVARDFRVTCEASSLEECEDPSGRSDKPKCLRVTWTFRNQVSEHTVVWPLVLVKGHWTTLNLWSSTSTDQCQHGEQVDCETQIEKGSPWSHVSTKLKDPLPTLTTEGSTTFFPPHTRSSNRIEPEFLGSVATTAIRHPIFLGSAVRTERFEGVLSSVVKENAQELYAHLGKPSTGPITCCIQSDFDTEAMPPLETKIKICFEHRKVSHPIPSYCSVLRSPSIGQHRH